MGNVYVDGNAVGTFSPQTEGTTGSILVDGNETGSFTLEAYGFVYANSGIVGLYCSAGNMGNVYVDGNAVGTFSPQTEGTTGSILVDGNETGSFTLEAYGFVYANSGIVGLYCSAGNCHLPRSEVVFGAVEPLEADILETELHLGCSKEVSSFRVLLQNWSKKYSPGEASAINVGNEAQISLGRGAFRPLLLTGRVESIEPFSTPNSHFISVKGRCIGEKLFRRVVTKEYSSQKGEAIVKDLMDSFAGLQHQRDGAELIENTDTTYTLLEYDDTPLLDILKFISKSADLSGVIGYDWRVEYDGKFAFFAKNSKTSAVSLTDTIEHGRFLKDIHRIRNKIKVKGAAEKPYPLDVDGQPWSDSLTEDLTKPNNQLDHADGTWTPTTGFSTLYIETTEVHTGSKSIRETATANTYYMGLKFTWDAGKYVNCNLYPLLCFTLQEDNKHNMKVTVQLEDSSGNICRKILDIESYDEWHSFKLPVGIKNNELWTMSVFNTDPFDWENLKILRIDFHQNSAQYGTAYVDRCHFGGRRWEDTEEDATSQGNYGLRELVEVDEELHSDNACELRAKALLDHLKSAREFIEVRSSNLDYGSDRLQPGDKITVVLPNENVNAAYRIDSVVLIARAKDESLNITLRVGKERPLLADYLYGLRSDLVTPESVSRTKGGE